MRAMMVRSIPLALDTRDAWKAAGAVFARRTSDDDRIVDISYGEPIINLGSSQCMIEGIWNEARVVEPLLTPWASRELLGSLMPSRSYEGPNYYWLKGAGRGGANKSKRFIRNTEEMRQLLVEAQWMEGDVQQHIDGQEYRVITVGEKVVQVTRRDGGHLASDRIYTWVGVTDAPSHVVGIAKNAARMLSSDKTIIGWDVIIDERSSGAYILEGNSCPGVNEATARRILDAVEGTPYNEEA